MTSRREVDKILAASSGGRYRPTLTAAGKRVTAIVDHENRLRRASAAAEGAWEQMPEQVNAGTAPPTPVHWVESTQDQQRLRPRAQEPSTAAGAANNRPLVRTVGTMPASVHGKPHQPYDQSELLPMPQPRGLDSEGRRSRTPEPRISEPERTLVRNCGARYESMGPVMPQTLDAGWANYRHSMPSHAQHWHEFEDEPQHSLPGEALPPLPSKAELHAYIRELVDARRELREHLHIGAFASVRAHYGRSAAVPAH